MAEDVASFHIPVVDFSAFSIAHQEVPGTTDPTVQQLVKDLYAGCSTLGFVYLTNHGIPQDEIEKAQNTLANFFALKPEVKAKYKKLDPIKYPCGWDGFQSQSASINNLGDLREGFDMEKSGLENFNFPDDLLPDFKPTVKSLYERFTQLGMRVLRALSIGLDVGPETFIFSHKELLRTLLRFNHYPGLTSDTDIKPGQIRCGEHSDWGSITLLIEDDAGGLEIATEDGTFIPVTPIPGTVLVNIADLMQRWSSDRYKSVVHRVIIPEEQSKKEILRQSIAFFLTPDDDTIISCLDGSDKYPAVKPWEYILTRLENSYK